MQIVPTGMQLIITQWILNSFAPIYQFILSFFIQPQMCGTQSSLWPLFCNTYLVLLLINELNKIFDVTILRHDFTFFIF